MANKSQECYLLPLPYWTRGITSSVKLHYLLENHHLICYSKFKTWWLPNPC